jgi:alkyl sulfatase BDS1-like metallo-beta-lactamase superfamily hydrolase
MSTTDTAFLPFSHTADFAAAEVVWRSGSYTDYLAADAPDTVQPSLWRQSTLCAKQGLFEVTDGTYQVRGYDLSNISFVEGNNTADSRPEIGWPARSGGD